MKLPPQLVNSQDWTLVGPMGPMVPEVLLSHSVLGVDGGARFCSHMDVWVGDGDSHLEQINSDYKYQFSPLKSASDMALALDLLSSKLPMNIHFWGFLGGRKDHELINLGEACLFLEKNPSSKIYFYNENAKIIFSLRGSGSWKFNHQGTFSLVCLKKIKFKLAGLCDYQVEDETELSPLSSLGLSNVAYGDFFVTSNGPFIIIFPENK